MNSHLLKKTKEMIAMSFDQYWAVRPETLQAIVLQIENNTEAIEQIASNKYREKKGIAEIKISGPLVKTDDWFTSIIGATSYESISDTLDDLAENPGIKGIVLNIDSPGGVVSGIDSVVDSIKRAAKVKPVVAFSDGMMCSAAYWIGSAASYIVASKNADIGSIGVVSVHQEFSKMNESEGITTTVFKAGEFKAGGNPYEPLTDKVKAEIQQRLDFTYNNFKKSIAKNRKTTIDKVNDMAEGRVFIGKQAKDIGLIDEIGNIDIAYKQVRKIIMDEIKTMDGLKEHYASLIEEHEKDVKNSQKESIFSLLSLFIGKEHADKFIDLYNSGISPKQFESVAAIYDNSQDKKADDFKAEMLEEIKKTGAENVGVSNDEQKKDFLSEVSKYQQNENVSYAKAISHIAKTMPELHSEYLNSL